ncbi:carboxymuconolactone decarboxylase family protein [Paenibacillus aurantiacus]|uniref:Carboxymuconolactone decarboxylase family protein n=1 Tax=Paenibacillus aurantiacus TaxID=1936118 RepID=A0ABV5KIP2_9BACL
MTTRHALHPASYGLMRNFHDRIEATSSLDKTLIELIKTRASQINGCAFCLDMHTKDARAHGETEQRLYTLSAWRETPFFTPREQAALALTEAVTRIADHHVPEDVYAEAARHFEPEQLSEVIMAIIAINAWNRIAITTGMTPS